MAYLAPEDERAAVRRDCRRVLRSPACEIAVEAFAASRDAWRQRAPDSRQALAEGIGQAMLPLQPGGLALRQPTNHLPERMAREIRRFL